MKTLNTRNKSSFRSKQDGLNLIELSLVIAIIAVIIAAALAAYSSTNNSNKAKELTNGFTSLSAAVHSIYGQQPDYSTLANDQQLAQSKALPPGMISGGNNVVSSYGEITVAVNGTNSRQVDITYASASIPSEVCSKFVPGLINNARKVAIGGVTISTPALAVTNCAVDVGNGNAGAIVITVD